jgi:CheY-like chemotaxis protein
MVFRSHFSNEEAISRMFWEVDTTKSVVLIVEDEPLVRWSGLKMLEDADFEVIEAANADEAIRILESRNDIRVVFTDVQMPGSMDGLKLAHAVRNRWPPIKIIVTLVADFLIVRPIRPITF